MVSSLAWELMVMETGIGCTLGVMVVKRVVQGVMGNCTWVVQAPLLPEGELDSCKLGQLVLVRNIHSWREAVPHLPLLPWLEPLVLHMS